MKNQHSRQPLLKNQHSRQPLRNTQSSGTGWFVGIIVALALLAVGYLVFSANTTLAPAASTAIVAPAKLVVG